MASGWWRQVEIPNTAYSAMRKTRSQLASLMNDTVASDEG
jgi:hypothetical protein